MTHIDMTRLHNLISTLFVLAAVGCATHSEADRMEVALPTPLEKKDHQALTTHEELVAFINELGNRSDQISVHALGESVEGRTIPYLKISNGTFGENRDEKLMLLIFAQQHGNEPSGMEAALAMARDFAEGRHGRILDACDILLVPQVNPDGGERHQRRNADNVDLNRSHLILDGKEVRHLRDLFHRWEPEVTVDVHEYQPWTNAWLRHGFIRLFDEQYGLPTNLNVHPLLRDLAGKQFLPFVARFLEERDFTFHNYTVGNPSSIRYSTSNINDGRHGFAILNSFGLILEGKNGRTPTDNIEHRTAAQVAALEALLHFCADHGGDIRNRVQTARDELQQGRLEKFILTMTRESDGNPLRIPARAVESAPAGHDDDYVKAGIIHVEIENYFPLVVAERETALPEAYVVPAGEQALIDLLRLHQVEMVALEEGAEFFAETFIIEDFVEGEYEAVLSIPVGRVERAAFTASKGDLLVPTAQLRGLLVATALEPQSMHGLMQHEQFQHLKAPGAFPIRRVSADTGG